MISFLFMNVLKYLNIFIFSFFDQIEDKISILNKYFNQIFLYFFKIYSV